MARDYEKNHPVLDPFLHSVFRFKARQIVGKAGITDEEARDVAQELFVRFLEQLHHFDGSNLHAFATMIANQGVTDYLRRRQATKRSASGTASLSAPVTGPDSSVVALADTITRDQLDAGRRMSRSDPENAIDLSLDLNGVVADLPSQQKALAERLMAGDSITQIARDLDVPRTTVSSWVRQIRERFEQAGLRVHL